MTTIRVVALLTIAASVAQAQTTVGAATDTSGNPVELADQRFRDGRAFVITGAVLAAVNTVAAVPLLAVSIPGLHSHDDVGPGLSAMGVAFAGIAMAEVLAGVVLIGVGSHFMTTAQRYKHFSASPLVERGALSGGALSYSMQF